MLGVYGGAQEGGERGWSREGGHTVLDTDRSNGILQQAVRRVVIRAELVGNITLDIVSCTATGRNTRQQSAHQNENITRFAVKDDAFWNAGVGTANPQDLGRLHC